MSPVKLRTPAFVKCHSRRRSSFEGRRPGKTLLINPSAERKIPAVRLTGPVNLRRYWLFWKIFIDSIVVRALLYLMNKKSGMNTMETQEPEKDKFFEPSQSEISLMNKVKFEVYGEEMMSKEVKPSGHSGRIYLPPEWIGKNLKIIRID